MNPEVIEALDALGNLALIVICVLFAFLTAKVIELQQKVISVAERLAAHVALDDERFTRINRDIGKLFSDTNDAKMENIGKWGDAAMSLLASKIDWIFSEKQHKT